MSIYILSEEELDESFPDLIEFISTYEIDWSDPNLKIDVSQKGESNNFYGQKHTPETRKYLSEINSGKNHHSFGKKRPDHAEFMKNNNPMHRTDVREKVSSMFKGRTVKDSTKELLKAHWAKNKEERKKTNNFILNNPSNIEWTCEHCGKTGKGTTNYKRWHGNACRIIK
jgi:hypothetical protein